MSGVSSLLRHRDASAVIVLALLLAFFALLADGFASRTNLEVILTVVAVTACVSLGQNLIMLAGEIDISLGSVLALAGFSAGYVALDTGSLVLTVGTAVGVGATAGLLNGLLVALTPVPSIVVTLGTLYALQGATLLISDSSNIVDVPDSAVLLGAGETLSVPHAIWTMVVVAIGVALLRRNTRWGRDLVALGGHPHAARTMGVPARRVLVIAFVAAGALTGIAAVVYMGQLGGIQVNVLSSNLILQVVAAVAVGGTSIKGGEGTDAAPVLGALIIGVVVSGIVILGVPNTWIPLVYGSLLLLAVARERFAQPGVTRVA